MCRLVQCCRTTIAGQLQHRIIIRGEETDSVHLCSKKDPDLTSERRTPIAARFHSTRCRQLYRSSQCWFCFHAGPPNARPYRVAGCQSWQSTSCNCCAKALRKLTCLEYKSCLIANAKTLRIVAHLTTGAQALEPSETCRSPRTHVRASGSHSSRCCSQIPTSRQH